MVWDFLLGVNVKHQEVARVDSKGVCGVRHRCSLAAICKVNVVENNIHLPPAPLKTVSLVLAL